MFPSKLRVESYEFRPFRLDLVSRQLFHQSKPLRLPSRTFDILKLLIESRGQVVTKEELIRRVWLDQFVTEINLTVRISALRKALGENARNRFIETVPGYGYRFVARVRQIFGEDAESQQEEPLDSLAVLPLINEDDQQGLNYLCDGITESLIISLSQIADLRVMARSTVYRFEGRKLDPQEVGKELGVRAVIVGKVNQVSHSLILNIEMIDVKDGASLWGGSYKLPITDLIALQEDLARVVSENLRIRLSKVEQSQITKRYTDVPQAHNLYMKGRYFWNKRSVFGVKKAIKYFRSAIRCDPLYALAFAGIADAFIVLSSYGLRPPKETMRKAKAAAMKALELDDQLAEPHVSMGNIKSSFELDWAGAETEFRLAIGLKPYYAPARQYYSNFLSKVCRLNEASVEISKAQEIDPLSLSVNLTMAKIDYFTRRYDEAVKKGREILEIEPQFGPANGLIGMAYLEMGRYQEAIREFKVMIEFSSGAYKIPHSNVDEGRRKSILPDSDPEAIALLGYAYALAGNQHKARQILDKLGELIRLMYVQPHNIALVYIGLGDHDKAFEWLDRAYEDRSSTLTFIKVGPFFDRLKTDPRYDRMVCSLGLQM